MRSLHLCNRAPLLRIFSEPSVDVRPAERPVPLSDGLVEQRIQETLIHSLLTTMKQNISWLRPATAWPGEASEPQMNQAGQLLRTYAALFFILLGFSLRSRNLGITKFGFWEAVVEHLEIERLG